MASSPARNGRRAWPFNSIVSHQGASRLSYICRECGEVHEEEARFFEWRRPQLRPWEVPRLRYDSRFTCRLPGRKYFIFCELELEFPDEGRKPLGFMGWAQVTRNAYMQYRRFRRSALGGSYRRRVVIARLANPVPAVPNSLGTRIRLNAFRGDPTPYIRWAAHDTPLAHRMKRHSSRRPMHSNHRWSGPAGLRARNDWRARRRGSGAVPGRSNGR